MEDFVLYSDDHFESHLLGNGLYQALISSVNRFSSLSPPHLDVQLAEWHWS